MIIILNRTGKINKTEESVVDLEEKTYGMSRSYTTIPAGQYYQVPFSNFCGFVFFRVSGPYYEDFKIYTVTIANKYSNQIDEIQSYDFHNNPNVNVVFESIGGEGDDINQYIRITNTGSETVEIRHGILNMI